MNDREPATTAPISPELEAAIRQLAEQLVQRQRAIWRWPFALAQRLMKFPDLADEHRCLAARIFRDQLDKLSADPTRNLEEEALAADLLRYALVPPRHAEHDNPLDAAAKKAADNPLHFKHPPARSTTG